MALLVLLVISLLAATMMTTIQVETKIAGHSVREAAALDYAEAGVGEAIARIRSGDIPSDGLNPRMVSQIFLAATGSVPSLTGPDSIAMETKQPAGSWLRYSTPDKTNQVLTVEYKTDSTKTVVYRYDSTKNPAINTVSGFPILEITSTGRKGTTYRRIVADVIEKPINANIKGSLVANVDVQFTGNAIACGYNHRADTPTYTGDSGRLGVGGCNESAQHWETGSGNLTGIWTGQNINNGGASNAYGSPALQSNQVGFYAGPWEAIGMAQADFFSWIGSAQSTAPSPPEGVWYLDNNSTPGDQSGGFAYHGQTGSGMLYVDGDLTLNAGFVYRGLVYVEGNLNLNGQAWILGALIVRGTTKLKANGGCTVLYSADAIQQNIARHGGQFVTLSWREMPY